MGEDEILNEGSFAQSLQEDGIVDWLLQGEQEGESVADGEPDSSRPRDPGTGRFVSAKEDEPEDDSADDDVPADAGIEDEAESEEPAEEEDDDDAEDGELVLELDETLEEVIARYGGDIGKALRSLAEKESMIGRQGNELGELRDQIAQLAELVQNQPQFDPRMLQPYEHDLDENPEGLLYEALERGDTETAKVALQAWGEESPFQAAAFLYGQQARLQAEQTAPPAVQRGSAETLEQKMSEVVQRHPDVEKYIPAIGEVAKEFPTLRSSMEQGTPAQKAQAFEELLVIAKNRSTLSDTSAAVKRVVLKTQEEVRKEKSDAAVVSAKTRSAATAKKSSLDEFFSAFDEAAERLNGSWITTESD